jgi:hypothetical protein
MSVDSGFIVCILLGANLVRCGRRVFGKSSDCLDFAERLAARIRFGEFVFDATAREPIRSGQRLDLSPKA